MFKLLIQDISPPPSYADLLRDTHTFYNDAWSSLLVHVSLAVAIVFAMVGTIGILFPYLLDRARKNQFKIGRDQIMAEIFQAKESIQNVESKTLAQIQTAQSLFNDKLTQALMQIDTLSQRTEQKLSALRCERIFAEAHEAAAKGPLYQAKVCLECIEQAASANPNIIPYSELYSLIAAAITYLEEIPISDLIKDDYAVTKLRLSLEKLDQLKVSPPIEHCRKTLRGCLDAADKALAMQSPSPPTGKPPTPPAPH
jgi:hypothetical protein